MLILAITKPTFEGTTQLLVDTRRGDASVTRSAVVDNGFIESQIAILRSDRLAINVIKKLSLTEDAEFVGVGPMGVIALWLGLDEPIQDVAEQRRMQRVLSKFKRRLNVGRIGHSYVAYVTFTSLDPVKAARLANEIVDAYIEDQLSARSAGAERAQSWTQLRLVELKEIYERAFRQLESFRADNNISGRDDAKLDSGIRAELRDLASSAQNHKRSYETFLNLNRYSQSSEERTLPITDARVISHALPPLVASSPRAGFWLILALGLGIFLGLIAAYIRERLDRTVRSRDQLEVDLHLPVLGVLPRIHDRHISVISMPPGDKSEDSNKANRVIRLVHDDPLKACETLIGLRAALDFSSSKTVTGRIIGITSPRNHEGKTTVAFNLAAAMVQSGANVLLIDGDMHTGILAGLLARGRKRGITHVLAGKKTLEESTVRCSAGFQLLAESRPNPRRHPANILSSPRMRDLLATAKSQYDYVVVDLPSALNHIDVQASASLFDNYILVAEFGRTTTSDLEAVIRKSSPFAERLLGIFVNKANTRTFNRNSSKGEPAPWFPQAAA